MKNILMLWLLLLLSSTAWSQRITITDSEAGQPVESATLLSPAASAKITTDVLGQADISAFKGAERIEIHSIHYKTVVTSYAELQGQYFAIALVLRSFDLAGVVVSATRWEQSTSDVPAKIVGISPKVVALHNPQTAADLLTLSGKVYVQKSQQGGGSPMIRGFSSNRLLYTVDGVRMNTAIFRGGNIQNVINLDPFAIENTEVFFGPGSVIYGSDAIGGVMSFRTLTPQFSESEKPLVTGKALTRYSSANQEKTGHFDVNLGWEKWALVTSFSAWNYGHLLQGSHGPEDYLKPYHVQRQDNMDVIITQDDPRLQVPTSYSQINMMQKIRFQPNENWDFQYGFHYSETSPYGRYDRHNRRRNGTARYAEWNYGPQKWMMNNLNISHSAGNALYDQLSLRLALQDLEESRINRNLHSSERSTQTERVKAWSANLDMTKKIGSRNTLFYGLEFVRNDVSSGGLLTDISDGAEMPGPSRYPNSDWSSAAIYLNDAFKVTDKFSLQGGLRYNQFALNAQFDTTFFPLPFTAANINNGALTGSIGGVYRPAESWVLSSNFGTAFRAPNVDDIGKIFDSEPGAVVIPNPDLKAEYAANIDAGIAKVFADRVKVDLTGYYTRLSNALVRRNFQLNGLDSIVYDGALSQVQAIQNAAVANVYGLQAGIEVKLPGGFSISSDLNFQEGEEELGDGSLSPSRHAAPVFGVSRLSYKADKLSLQLYASYQGERKFEDLPVTEQAKDEIYAKDANGNNYSPAWYTLNFKALFQFTENLSVSSGLENITDQRYRPYSSGMSAAGRNFLLSVQATF